MRPFLFVLALCCAAGVRAAEDASPAYRAGLAKERARDYQGALWEFESISSEAPAFASAQKQMGNCFYYLGDDQLALQSYDQYLGLVPGDAATRAFAERLRQRVRTAAAEIHRSSAQDLPDGTVIAGRFYAGAGFGTVLLGAGDVAGGAGTGGSVVSSYSAFGDAHFGYQSRMGLAGEVGYQFLDRFVTLRDAYGIDVPFGLYETDAYAEPLYRFRLGPQSALLVGLQVGQARVTVLDPSTSAQTLMFAPEIRYEGMMDRFAGVDLGVLYRMANFGAATSASGEAGPSVVDSGLALRMGLNVYFGRLIE